MDDQPAIPTPGVYRGAARLRATGADDPEPVARLSAAAAAEAAEHYGTVGKRVLDICLAMVLLISLVLVFALIALAVKLDSAGPVFYRVRRAGWRGRPLLMLKFRKMTNDARGGPLTVAHDPRLTRVGRLLTLTRLDELPQLWDVLRGRMSIVGPRPEDPGFVALHSREYSRILAVRPGITGLSQIAYRDESAIVDAVSPVEQYLTQILPQKLTLDTLYAESCSLRLDLWILLWTFMTAVLRHPVSVDRVTAAMRIRRRQRQIAAASAPVPSPEVPGLALEAVTPPSSSRADP